ncbi:ROK family protein [Radiobacillus kanasensis]|uniref:ROK family protein n=1 Tax=Radiobacillus kanasensis TaxID=2844358 RepID=UPI001E55456F|nr:ROK family protein [Radiobacillus kanasensis]UFT98588.1 ROK family protein [Radiobacillus kanasensis]
MEKYVAIDVGGTKVKHSVLLSDGTILTKDKYNTNIDDLNIFLSNMVTVIQDYQLDHEIHGVAISLPGFVNVETGFTEHAGAINALHGKNLKELLEEIVDLPVAIENDGNCVALAEKLSGNAVECDSFICFTIGTGIGGGIYLNGKMVHGHSSRGGEFGFMVTRGDSLGLKIMHDNAAMKSLIGFYRDFKGLPEQAEVEGHVIFEEAKTDEKLHAILEKWYESISFGIFNLVATLNPEKILIGGGVSSRSELLSDINRHLDELPWWNHVRVPIEVCKHQNDAGMLGALQHFLTSQSKKLVN